jgi:hypothetical protein
MATTQPAEVILAQIWNAQWLQTGLTTTGGAPLSVVYRGVWTHGLGPDFAGAYLDLGGQLRRGDVEIHVRTSDWLAHGHHLDPNYDDVILHVVLDDDLSEPPRRHNGGTIATLALAKALPGPIDAFPGDGRLQPLGAIGFEHCAPRTAAAQPQAIARVWEEAGDRRLHGKVEALLGRLALEPPAQTLYAALLDALGYSRNREGMAALAARLPYDHLDAHLAGLSPSARRARAAGLLLGVAGFLPLSPREAELAALSPAGAGQIEREWLARGSAWHDARLPAAAWQTARVRPAAHPLRRLLALATLLARLERGLIEDLTGLMVDDGSYASLVRWLTDENPYLGAAHAHEVIVNVFVPFALAYGDAAGAERLIEAATTVWSNLPPGQGNAEIRRTARQICGSSRVPVRSARAEQGLLHLRRTGCAQMRCFECPIALLEVGMAAGESERLTS